MSAADTVNWRTGSIGFYGFLERQPVLSAVLAVACVKGVPAAVDAVAKGLGFLTGLVLIVLAIVILHRQGWAAKVGFNGPAKWTDVWLVWMPFAYAAIPFINWIWSDLERAVTGPLIVMAVVQGVMTAFVEETVFRGLVLAILLNRFHSTLGEIRGSIIFSSILFGFWHFPRNPYWEINISQWVYAAFAGVGFAAVVLRTRSIWLMMVAHALLVAGNGILRGLTAIPSAASSVSEIRLAAALPVVLTLPALIYGLHLIRNLDLNGRSEASQSATADGRT